MSNELYHYGTPQLVEGSEHGSGRYRKGSGDNPFQHEPFLQTYRSMKNNGLSETEIAQAMGMTVTELRNRKSITINAERADKLYQVEKLKEKGYSNVAIGEKLGINESSVRSLLNNAEKIKNDKALATAQMLKEQLKEKGCIDVGAGIERELGITRTKLDTALELLQEEGYNVYGIKMKQVTDKNQFTNLKVLTNEDVTWAQVQNNQDMIQTINAYSNDGGEIFRTFETPRNLDSSRIQIVYGDEGGVQKDGVIELRRGVDDISLGESAYAQVRIAVDGTHYLKGMAIYADDLPDGVDVRFNTNKASGTPMEKVLKSMKDDPDNPFGAVIKATGQTHYIDENGVEQLSCVNKIKEEGDWDKYSKSLSSQFLSKQSLQLINSQLKLAYADKLEEYNEIMSLTQPSVKKKMLADFAEECDGAAVDLKAAALPRQSSKVILPVSGLKDNEIYAPTYQNGETVCLVRYPHGGTFEIPQLVVNNKNADGKAIVGADAIDAVGINSKVAERLSGADFDGDTVVVIPSNSPKSSVKIAVSDQLPGLKDFDPKTQYAEHEGMKYLSEQQKQKEMGKVSNLITDMTIKGAPMEDIELAVKHSMVVIDAEKHKLDYKQSEKDNHIKALKDKWQDGGGASTLISKASSELRVEEKASLRISDIDPETGKITYRKTDRTYMGEDGKEHKALEKSTKMAETDDAFTLSSGTQKEAAYAQYANSLKALANTARKEMLATKTPGADPGAKVTYGEEVDSLNRKLNSALLNAPKERAAQLAANSIVASKKRANPNMSADEEKKVRNQALASSRAKMGANKKSVQVQITNKEWEAIQNNAISPNKLSQILSNADKDRVRELATPKKTNTISSSKASAMIAMKNSGFTLSEIAERYGCSPSAVSSILKNS